MISQEAVRFFGSLGYHPYEGITEDFDERDHGFSTFSRLLEALEKEGLLKRQQQGRQWYVVPADAAMDSKGGSDSEPGSDPGDDEFPF